jgi:predicted lipid-binding transport protein (Tim44 family)
MRRLRIATIVLSCAILALAPSLAEARAGNQQSQGSRGSRTNESSSTARPVERTVTPTAPNRTQQTPQATPRPAPTAPVAGGGFFQRHPFMTGLMGGFIGAGLAGMIFGSGAHAAAADASPAGNMLGLLLQLALIGGLGYLAYRLFFRRRDATATPAGNTSYYSAEPMSGGHAAIGGGTRPAGGPVQITDADYTAFGDLLMNIQGAWSKGDLAGLRRHLTPEMLSYFSEELSRNASQGVENKVENITLVKGDLLEAWEEDGMEYATASLRFSASDYMVRPGTNQIVSGNQQPTEATEVWTFVRSRGGQWLLSAIQQTN